METKSVRLERKALARSGEGGKERVVEGSTERVRGRKPSYITVDISVSLCDFFLRTVARGCLHVRARVDLVES